VTIVLTENVLWGKHGFGEITQIGIGEETENWLLRGFTIR
jgi:hypothetical protein